MVKKCIVFTLLIIPLYGFAQRLKDIGRTILAPVTAPIESTIKIIKGDDPKSAIISPWEPAGRVLEKTSDKFQRAHDVFCTLSGNKIENSLGKDWRKAYETLTAIQRVQFELTTTAGRFLGKCLQGDPCSLNELVAAPLAAAMRDAYKIYFNYSFPLPQQIVNALSRIIPYNIAASARWTVGNTPNFSVPGFLNYGNSVFGYKHAVTLGNVIIFSEWPDLNTYGGWEWLLHELYHYEQYLSFNNTDVFEGIDGFAVEYIQHHRSMENAAKTRATERLNELW